MVSTEQITEHLKFLDNTPANTVAYHISGNANGDEWSDIVVILNGNPNTVKVNIPESEWKIVMRGSDINEEGVGVVTDKEVSVSGISAMILVK